MTRVRFTLGDFAEMVAGLEYYPDATTPDAAGGDYNFAFSQCKRIRKFGAHCTQYEGAIEHVKVVLKAIEGCPAYYEPGAGSGLVEGFGGDYHEVQAVRRASDSIRKALGMPLLGYRRRRRRRSRR